MKSCSARGHLDLYRAIWYKTRMNSGKIRLIIFLALLVFPGTAHGGRLTLVTEATCASGDQGVEIMVTTSNVGREPAVHLTVTAFLGGESRTSEVRPELGPGRMYTVRLHFAETPAAPGVFGVPVVVDFYDRGGYPYSGLAHASFVKDEPAWPQVVGRIKPARIVDQGLVSLELTNLDVRPRTVDLHLMVPGTMGARETERRVTLDSQAVVEVDFAVERGFVRPPADEKILATIEYTAEGVHFSSVAEGPVRIDREASFFKRHRMALLAAALLLALAAGAYQLIRPSGQGGARL